MYEKFCLFSSLYADCKWCHSVALTRDKNDGMTIQIYRRIVKAKAPFLAWRATSPTTVFSVKVLARFNSISREKNPIKRIDDWNGTQDAVSRAFEHRRRIPLSSPWSRDGDRSRDAHELRKILLPRQPLSFTTVSNFVSHARDFLCCEAKQSEEGGQ